MRKRTFFLVLTGCLLLCDEAAAGRLPYGSPGMQERQNAAADRFGLSRVKDLGMLRRFIEAGRLVKIENTSSYALETVGSHDHAHAELYAHARPWVKSFLDRELGAGAAKYGMRFKVTSLVRTRAYQRSLCRHGGSGAICGSSWWKQSSHLTGSTVDITKKDLNQKARTWLESRIVELAKRSKVIAIQEGDCYHVMVLPSYDDPDKAATTKRRKTRKKERHKARR